jgi:hypothetical protein
MRALGWTIAAIGFLLLALPCAGPAKAAQTRVLVVYDETEGTDRALTALAGVLAHFDCTIATLATAAYRGGEARDCDALIYLGLGSSAQLPEALLSDIQDSDRRVCWLGRNLDQLAARYGLQRYGMKLSPRQPDGTYREVRYHSQILERGDAPPVGVTVVEPAVCRVVATVSGDGPVFPYTLRSGRFWYFADVPVMNVSPNGSHLVLCEELHDILGQRHAARRRALLCLDGVDVHTDPDRVQKLSRFLAHERVPFAISVTPVLVEKRGNETVPLSHSRTLVGMLREAQRAGATVIADGSRETRAEALPDEALWQSGGPDAVVRPQRAVAELLRCGLFPLAWATRQTPSATGQRSALTRQWSTIWERRPMGEDGPEGQAVPFLAEPSDHRPRVLPDNLLPLRERAGVEGILEQARVYTNALRDPWLVVSVSPEVSPEAVKMLVFELRAMRYDFADLRRMANSVRGDSLRICSAEGPVSLTALIPQDWAAMVLGLPPAKVRAFDRPSRDGRERTELEPGEILVAYPANRKPAQIFAFEGGPVAAADRLVELLAAVAMAVGVLIAAAFVFTYVVHLVLRRA